MEGLYILEAKYIHDMEEGEKPKWKMVREGEKSILGDWYDLETKQNN